MSVYYTFKLVVLMLHAVLQQRLLILHNRLRQGLAEKLMRKPPCMLNCQGLS